MFFVSAGIDYHFQIRVGDKVLLDQEGMFTPVALDVTDFAPGTVLAIVVRPVPKYPKAHRPKAQASRSVKPSVSYGWDFHPRLVPLGIWDETHLEIRNRQSLLNTQVRVTLDVEQQRAELQCVVEVGAAAQAASVSWEVCDPSGATAVKMQAALVRGSAHLGAAIDHPLLWWCNGQGDANLYTSTIRLLDGAGHCVDEKNSRIGIRKVKLVMNEDAWKEPSTFPKTRSTPPMTIELNGRKIFAKGSNWVCPDIFAGTLTREEYAPLLHQAHAAHFNILRCWGGATINKQSFYDLCDELGILIWQEFPLACNTYEDDERYLQVLDQESRSIITQLREHACLAMWCGGNELFNWWSAMTDQHLALRMLNANCFQLDPQTPFLPTSPVMGVGHGDYRFRDDEGREVFQMFRNASNSAYTEFGVPGPASVDTLASFIPADELFPPRRGTTWQTHHAFDAWFVAPESWLFVDLIEEYFGPCETLTSLVERGQLLQSEGYKCLFEEARRQKPFCSMALNWCYNEPWPTAANNSIVSWPAVAKPALRAVAAACRPSLLSAQIPKFSWSPGELFCTKLAVLHDGPTSLGPVLVKAFLICNNRPEVCIGEWQTPGNEANVNLLGPTLSATLPLDLQGTFALELRSEGQELGSDLSSRYVLCAART